MIVRLRAIYNGHGPKEKNNIKSLELQYCDTV